MGKLATGYPTLADVASRTDPSGKIAKIVESMNKVNEVLLDAFFVKCNSKTTHKTTVRTGLPSAYWRMIGEGVAPTKGTTKQIMESTAELMAYSQVDKTLADIAGAQAFRSSEALAQLEGMNQSFASNLFYGDAPTNPQRFTGFAPRFNSHSGTDRQLSSFNVIDGGAAANNTDNTSIYLVGWGELSVHCIYPDGTPAGLTHKDLGEADVADPNDATKIMPVYRDRFQWDVGLAVRDWRFVSRICNIDVGKLGEADGANLVDLLITAYHKVRRYRKLAHFAIYANPTILEALDKQARTDVGGTVLSYKDWAGEEVLDFRGMPIRECDAILDAEDHVTAAA